MPTPRSPIIPLTPYIGPAGGRITTSDLLLDANECTLGPSEIVLSALQEALKNPRTIRCYPEYGHLSDLLAQYAGLSAACVLPTNGSDQAIDIIMRCYADRDDEVIIPAPSFATFFHAACLQGCTIRSPLYSRESGFPIDDVLAAINPRTRVIVICNPNNPTGTVVDPDAITRIALAAPDAIILVDECYVEFSDVTVAPLLCEYPNIVITRTLSKTWALAGLRIGYILAPKEIITELSKVRGPYDVNALAAIGACAALSSPESMHRYAKEVSTVSRPLFQSFLEKKGIPFWESRANFILLQPPHPERCEPFFNAAGLRIRPRSGPAIEGTVRITLGTQGETERLIEVFERFLASANV
jgi:histidinol-phosphate aminotransferase